MTVDGTLVKYSTITNFVTNTGLENLRTLDLGRCVCLEFRREDLSRY